MLSDEVISELIPGAWYRLPDSLEPDPSQLQEALDFLHLLEQSRHLVRVADFNHELIAARGNPPPPGTAGSFYAGWCFQHKETGRAHVFDIVYMRGRGLGPTALRLVEMAGAK